MSLHAVHTMTAQAVPYDFPEYTYRHYHDIELARLRVRKPNGEIWTIRNPNDLPGTPEVYVLYDYSIILTDQWQYYLIAINPGMALQHIATLLNTNRAFCNTMGFPDRANYILGEALDKEDPKYSKAYICGGGLISGTPQGDFLLAHVMDGNLKPPLKPGRIYPSQIADIRLDDYLWNPKDHPWMFIAAVNVTDNGSVFPFPNGGLYPWTPEPSRMFSFLPLASRREIYYPLSHLQKVNHWISPYYVST